MDRTHYVSEAERQLTDSTFYNALDHGPSNEFTKKVTDVICNMLNDNHIRERNAVNLTVDRLKARRFTSYPRFTRLKTLDVP